MRRITTLSLVIFLTVAASVPLALAQGTYTQIDYPGAYGTAAFGINAAGDISGTYLFYASGYFQGFLLGQGTYATIDYPGAQDTYVQGINDQGQVVGFTDHDGFLYDVPAQTFTLVIYPGVPFTFATAINNAGTITGYFTTRNHRTNGFELVGTTYSRIAPQGYGRASVFGISGSGRLVGEAYIQNTGIGFSFDHGKYRRIVIPNAPDAVVTGVNPAGNALLGYYAPTFGTTAGFLYQNKILQTLQFPGATNTYAFGINDAGEVVGYFLDVIGYHGFLWTPPPADAAKK